eukprot:4959193-Amphidinium_carterae.1
MVNEFETIPLASCIQQHMQIVREAMFRSILMVPYEEQPDAERETFQKVTFLSKSVTEFKTVIGPTVHKLASLWFRVHYTEFALVV